MQLIDSPLCRRYGAQKEISAHIVCECEALVTLRHAYLHSFFLDPEDVNSLKSGTIWNFIKGTGHPTFDISLTLRSLTLYIYIYGAPILDVSRSHTTTQHSQ